ncbi:MAG TPA: hypothetical protein VMT28_02150 [Terriglobales bacterium]|nr:hypothetical protein [Terriglobales bacterium]
MRMRHLLGPALTLLFAVTSLMAATPCPPSTPWPPAAGPIVKAVPWVTPVPPTCLITPHDTISGRTIYLKATTDSTAVQYYWDYGDGSPVQAWTAVSSPYNIGIQHVYTGATNTSFTATVYVKDGANPPNVNSAKYYITIRDNTLQARVNIAIDEGMWRLQREMQSRTGVLPATNVVGYWNSGNYASSGYVGNNGVNTTAFLVNGHQPDTDPANPDPYAETALRGLNATLWGLSTTNIPSSVTNSQGTFNPDQNANGIATYVPESPIYESGMVMDMIAATGQQNFVAGVGNPGIVNQTLKTIEQDMMDFYTYCQIPGAPEGYSSTYEGGWRYSCRSGDSDNSTSQWGAIGMLGAVKEFGLAFPPAMGGGTSPVLLANQNKWLTYTFDGNGFGYTSPGYYPWGPWAVTPSGMVQMAMDGVTRGTPGSPTMWDHTENYIRANFSGPLGYWYGLFSFTKSMLLNPAGDLTQLCGRDGFPSNNLVNCIDWYAAETAKGDPIDGVAKTLVNAQAADGYWWCHEYTGQQCYFETAWAIIMLNRTVFTSGLPVAVIDASPTQVINGGMVNFTGKNSFHQDATKQIVMWDWDFSGTGSGPFNVSGVNQNNVVIHTNSNTFPVNYPVRLRVTDNTSPTPLTAIATVNIVITNPPFPPTASPGGPYSICPQPAYLPFYLNGTGSSAAPGHSDNNPDNYLTKYEWDPLGNGTYPLSGGTLAQPRVDDFYANAGLLGSGATEVVNLRVTDNSALSFPPSPNLTATASTQVLLRTATDPVCSKCVNSAQAIGHGAVPGHAGYIQVIWIETGADHYNIYRSTVNGGPYTKLGTVKNTVMGTGKTLGYMDNGPLTPGVTYYYRIAPATLADIETCQSNQANASGSLPKGR